MRVGSIRVEVLNDGTAHDVIRSEALAMSEGTRLRVDNVDARGVVAPVRGDTRA